ncbi:MAG: leucyl/phenylalanyl-tRNA--protein transferase [Lewinellaceae bacterium]|nr:leucyl/phenylalanyl-tRNA--protein transferase [Saprospiraceae bacterium]MCB9343179.1 leucyl/phenylalanyl-tRNA--protein transferase [Lewinellaceae bacterium]
MPVFLLNSDDTFFPNVDMAEKSGLLAVGGDLSEARLLAAYCSGIFPWFQEDQDFFWYAPNPRFVLFPNELKVHKSMRSIFNQQKFRVTLDTCFEQVMRNCANTPRSPYDGTWITDDFVEGYRNLHEKGLAHSVEVWQDDELVGGLYGVSIGKIFFGESMFAQVTNASKTGFITLVRALEKMGFILIDCQVETVHLGSLGARGIPRKQFQEYLAKNAYYKTLIGKWRFSEDGGIECIEIPAE